MTSSRKGLLPQLLDVLYALTDSQQLLTTRVRQAHLESLHVHSRDEKTWKAVPFEPTRPQTPPRCGTVLALGPDLREPHQNNPQDFPMVLSLPNDADCSRKLGVDHATAIRQHPEFIVSDPPTGLPNSRGDPMTRHVAMPIQASEAESNWLGTVDVVNDDHNYNYFDELDARLASLHHSDDATDETAS